MWCRIARSDTRPPRGSAGFTLIEVLVAIAVLAVVLGAIGAVVGNTVRAIRSVDRRLPLLETAQNLLASLPSPRPARQVSTAGASTRFCSTAMCLTIPRRRSGCRLRSPCGSRAAKARRCGSTQCV
jgi:prepilin-type N-terminal cleavage/methylation domain-containing protein